MRDWERLIAANGYVVRLSFRLPQAMRNSCEYFGKRIWWGCSLAVLVARLAEWMIEVFQEDCDTDGVRRISANSRRLGSIYNQPRVASR